MGGWSTPPTTTQPLQPRRRTSTTEVSTFGLCDACGRHPLSSSFALSACCRDDGVVADSHFLRVASTRAVPCPVRGSRTSRGSARNCMRSSPRHSGSAERGSSLGLCGERALQFLLLTLAGLVLTGLVWSGLRHDYTSYSRYFILHI